MANLEVADLSYPTGRAVGPIDLRALHLAVGLGDAELERAVLPALSLAGDVAVTRFLSADALVAALREGRADVALVSSDLYRLDDLAIEALDRLGVPIVLLRQAHSAARALPHSWTVLRAGIAPAAVSDAVKAAGRGAPAASPLNSTPRAAKPSATPDAAGSRDSANASPQSGHEGSLSDAARAGGSRGAIIAVWSGPGSPGRTTVAINLGAALARLGPTVVVDADLAGPSIAAYLDLDPTRNICMVAHAAARDARSWADAVADEVQPLAPGHAAYHALCGVPRPGQRGLVSAPLLDRVLRELALRYRHVVLDVGADIVGDDAAVHRLALQRARDVVLLGAGDLVGLWRTSVAAQTLESYAPNPERAVTLVLNRYDPRRHYSLREVAWTLKLPVAAAVPEDRRGTAGAERGHVPWVLSSRGGAGRAVLDLARRWQEGGAGAPQLSVGGIQRRSSFPLAWLGRPRWWPARARVMGGRP